MRCMAVDINIKQLRYAGLDMRKLEAGVHMVSGTPGRVFDMIKRRSFRTREIKLLVLDEADEMLNQGFKEQIYDVYRYLPPNTQVRLVPDSGNPFSKPSGCSNTLTGQGSSAAAGRRSSQAAGLKGDG